MPQPRQRFGYRDRMEALLTDDERVILAAICRASNVAVDLWHLCDAIAPAWENLAVDRLAKRIRIEEQCSEKDARVKAAVRLGLSDETIKTRLNRWARAAYRRVS